MQITYAKYSPSIILNCARYLGSKLPLNNRAWRTFSCIDPTARGKQWTVGQVRKTIPEIAVIGARSGARVSCRPPPPWKIKKKFSLYVWTF